MTSIAYFNAGSSVYDYFFLSKFHQKFNVFLLTFSPRPKYLPNGIRSITIPEPIGQFPVHDAPRAYPMMPFKVMMSKKFLKNIKPDVLIGCGLDYGFLSARSGYRPFVLFIWGSEVLLWPKFLPFGAMMKFALKKADLVVLDSNIQLKSCVKLGCNKKKIIRLPWIDSEEVEKLARGARVERDEFRKKLGWNEEDPIITCTRSHKKTYDIETIVQAIPIILREMPNVRFLFIGKGSLTEKLRQMTERLNIEENVRFAGLVPHHRIFYYLKNSDIYASSSLSDGTSASLLEAMTCKLPCIVSDIPGNKEWIKNMENGLVFPTKDSRALAKKIITLIKNEDLSTRLAENAFKTVRERANWRENSKVLNNLIERLAEKKVTR